VRLRNHEKLLNIYSDGLPRSGIIARHSRGASIMKVKTIIAALIVAVAPVSALAQKDAAALKAEAQKIVETIGSDKAKSTVYCDVVKLGDQIDDAVQKKDSKRAGELSLQMDGLEKTLGSDYTALMDELQDIDAQSKDAADIG
jgi:hypothetical protein